MTLDLAERPAIARATMTELARPRLARTLFALAFDYAVCVGVIVAAVRVHHWAATIVAVAIVAGRQHALAVLMHEAAHRNISRERRVNEVVGQVLCAWPVFLDVWHYAAVHTVHHRFEGTEGDPDLELRAGADWTFPQTKGRIAWLVARDALGLGVVDMARQLKFYGSRAPREVRARWIVAKVAFYATAAALITYAGLWPIVLLYWVLPLFTFLKAFVRVREIAEHYGVAARHALDRTRTTHAGVLARAFIAPHHVGLHLEHHLFPGVPWHSLPALRRELRRDADYRARAHVSQSYLAALGECASTAP